MKMSDSNGAKEIKDNLQDLADNANKVRQTVADQLKDAVSKIQDEVDKSGGNWDEEAQKRTKDVISKLENAADYLEKHSVEQIEAEAKEVVQENVWVSLAIAFVVGLILGWILTRD